MLDAALLDVCIGLMVVYLTLALATTAAGEIVAAALRLRANNLHDSLVQLLGDERAVAALLAHPRLRGAVEPGVRPEWLPREAVAQALVALAGAKDADVAALRASLAQEGPLPAPVREALRGVLADGVANAAAARAAVATWFDDAMERASARYRRRMQGVSLGLSALVVLAVDADTLQLAHASWHNDQLRAVMVDRAERLSEDANVLGRQLRLQTEELAAQVAAMQAASLPLGWTAADVAALDPRQGIDAAATWLSRLIGWALSTLAVSLGAPFWFDMLGRATRARRDASPPEAADVGA